MQINKIKVLPTILPTKSEHSTSTDGGARSAPHSAMHSHQPQGSSDLQLAAHWSISTDNCARQVGGHIGHCMYDKLTLIRSAATHSWTALSMATTDHVSSSHALSCLSSVQCALCG